MWVHKRKVGHIKKNSARHCAPHLQIVSDATARRQLPPLVFFLAGKGDRETKKGKGRGRERRREEKGKEGRLPALKFKSGYTLDHKGYGLDPEKYVGTVSSEYVLTALNVTSFHSKLLLDNSASFMSSRMKYLWQKWKVKLIFRGA